MSTARALSAYDPYHAPVVSNDDRDPLVEAIERHGVHAAAGKDEEIYGQGEAADAVYLLLSGHVRTVRFMADGRRQVGAFHGPGEVFGLETGAEHRYAAEALCDCRLVVLKRSLLRTLVAGDAAVEWRLWTLTLRALDQAQDQLLLLGRKTACEKVATFLLDRAAAADEVELPMGRQDIADHLGLTIETVSRMLTQLQCSRMIAFPHLRRVRITNRDGLEDLSV
jgi:CRP/FNR family nitrogen fixation transcriptional regulator